MTNLSVEMPPDGAEKAERVRKDFISFAWIVWCEENAAASLCVEVVET